MKEEKIVIAVEELYIIDSGSLFSFNISILESLTSLSDLQLLERHQIFPV